MMPDDVTTEIAKEMGKEAVKQAGRFFDKVLGKPLGELASFAGDSLRFYRFKKQVELFSRANEICEERNLNVNRLPLSTLFPLVENATIEEDESMSEKWAALLASAATSKDNELSKSYVHILKSISPISAKLLDFMVNGIKDEPGKLPIYQNRELLCSLLKISEYQYMVIVDNLIRLNLIERYPISTASHPKVEMFSLSKPAPQYEPGPFYESSMTDEVHAARYRFVSLTSLGYNFVRACRSDMVESTEQKTKLASEVKGLLR